VIFTLSRRVVRVSESTLPHELSPSTRPTGWCELVYV
jgi:hypothetical protein